MSHFTDLMLGLWMWDTPTVNVLGRSSDIGSLSLPFPSVICLSEPQQGAIAKLRLINSTLLKPEMLLPAGGWCSHPSTSSPSLLFLCFHGWWAGGTGSLLVLTVIFDSSHMADVTSPVSLPACGHSGLLYVFSDQEVHLIDGWKERQGFLLFYEFSQFLSMWIYKTSAQQTLFSKG